MKTLKAFIVIFLTTPILVIANLIGAVCAVTVCGFFNGFRSITEYLDQIREEF